MKAPGPENGSRRGGRPRLLSRRSVLASAPPKDGCRSLRPLCTVARAKEIARPSYVNPDIRRRIRVGAPYRLERRYRFIGLPDVLLTTSSHAVAACDR